MILPCGCDSIWTSYFDRCIPCRNKLSIEAQDWIKRYLDNRWDGHNDPDYTMSGGKLYFCGQRAENDK